MDALPNSYSAAAMAVKIEQLEANIARLERRLAIETDRSDHFALRYEHLKKVLHSVELLDCSSISIENNGGEGLPWEISVCAVVEGVDPIRWRLRDQYFGATLKDALERLAKKEVGV